MSQSLQIMLLRANSSDAEALLTNLMDMSSDEQKELLSFLHGVAFARSMQLAQAAIDKKSKKLNNK